MLRVVQNLGDPYRVKPGLGGMTAYPPKAMAVACIIMEAERKTCRKTVGHPRNSHYIVLRIGLHGIPSKSTITRACGLIPDQYLMKVRRMAIQETAAGPVAGNSAGYSDSRLVRWYDARTDSVRTKKGWARLHGIIDMPA